MVNILVPTDFSELSMVAVQYATKIANKLNGTLTLLHVVNTRSKVKASLKRSENSMEREMILVAQAKMDALVEKTSKFVKNKQPIRYKVAAGISFVDTVGKEAKRLHIGLIVIGTKGAGGLKKVVMGSNTTSIIEISHVPVLAVPAEATFKNFSNILYATDGKNVEKELKTLIPYVERFGATLHLLHILSRGKDVDQAEMSINAVVDKLAYKNIVVLVTVSQSIDSAIDQYIDLTSADLLAMFTHELTFYEKLFDRSYTRRMAFQSKIPLLAFKDKKRSRS
jgi:nucleotide-binding universal stress UspA family protein